MFRRSRHYGVAIVAVLLIGAAAFSALALASSSPATTAPRSARVAAEEPSVEARLVSFSKQVVADYEAKVKALGERIRADDHELRALSLRRDEILDQLKRANSLPASDIAKLERELVDVERRIGELQTRIQSAADEVRSLNAQLQTTFDLITQALNAYRKTLNSSGA